MEDRKERDSESCAADPGNPCPDTGHCDPCSQRAIFGVECDHCGHQKSEHPFEAPDIGAGCLRRIHTSKYEWDVCPCSNFAVCTCGKSWPCAVHGGPPTGPPSNEEIIQDDVGAILRALGLGDHARPISCHEVVQREIIPAIRELQSDLEMAKGDALEAVTSKPTAFSEGAVALSERERCKRDVCSYCGGRALGYYPARGPNSAGNWTHTPQGAFVGAGSDVLCPASGIFSREKWIALGRQWGTL